MAEPTQRRTAEDGGKYYEHPTRVDGTGAPRRYTSVTTALGIKEKSALIHWATGLAAGRAMANLPRLIAAARIEPCGRTRKRTGDPRCGECAECVAWWCEGTHHGERERRAREGSAIHDVIEHWSKTGQIRYEPSEHLYEKDGATHQVSREAVQPYIDSFLQWVADYGITPESFLACEATVWHHLDGWAGTTDGILLIKPVTAKAAKLCVRVNLANGKTGDALLDPIVVLLDNKSREKADKAFYTEYPLQAAAYRHAETMTPKHGLIEIPMPRTDGAVIFQPRPGSYSFEPIVAGKREYQAFLQALALFHWDAEHGQKSIQVGTFPTPEGWKAPTWERASPPTGGLCGCPYCDDPADGRCQFSGARPLGKHTKEVDADGNPVKPKRAPRKAAAPKATGPQSGTVIVVDREDGAAVYYPPAELLAEQAEAPAPPVKRAPRGAAKKAAANTYTPSATLDSMRQHQRIIGAEIADEDIPF